MIPQRPHCAGQEMRRIEGKNSSVRALRVGPERHFTKVIEVVNHHVSVVHASTDRRLCETVYRGTNCFHGRLLSAFCPRSRKPDQMVPTNFWTLILQLFARDLSYLSLPL